MIVCFLFFVVLMEGIVLLSSYLWFRWIRSVVLSSLFRIRLVLSLLG